MNNVHIISNEMRSCAHLCHECQDACLELLPHCLEMGGDHAEAAHILMLIDCAQICDTAEEFMHRSSSRHGLICRTCAEICLACAADCERFDGDLAMQHCASLCRQCADQCLRMSGESAESRLRRM